MSSKKEVIFTKDAPLPIVPTPFCQAVKCNGMVYCSGNVGMTPDGEMVKGSVGDRTVLTERWSHDQMHHGKGQS